MTPRNVVLEGDAVAVLRTLASSSIDCVVTSPPYFRARLYAAGAEEIGTEEHVDEWVDTLRAVSAKIARVLVPTGSYWLNIGDLYSRHVRLGAPPKSLLLGPERLVRGVLADGWIIRNRVAWIKNAPLPSPVLDRLTNGWDYVFHLVRQRDYFCDLDAIREPLASTRRRRTAREPDVGLGQLAAPRIGLRCGHLQWPHRGRLKWLHPRRCSCRVDLAVLGCGRSSRSASGVARSAERRSAARVVSRGAGLLSWCGWRGRGGSARTRCRCR